MDIKMANIVLQQIGELGRWDYVLEALNTPLEKNAILLIKSQLFLDEISKNPTLLAKWLPTLRTHNKNNIKALELVSKLEISEREYRTLLSAIRKN